MIIVYDIDQYDGCVTFFTIVKDINDIPKQYSNYETKEVDFNDFSDMDPRCNKCNIIFSGGNKYGMPMYKEHIKNEHN